MAYRNLDVLDAAEQAAKQLNDLIERSKCPRLLHVRQMRKSAQSVVANITEGFGRGKCRERDHALRVARGEAEETIGHLKANFLDRRLCARDYYALRNRYVVIVKMLNSLLNG
jgi:four helix bundle protein